MEIQLTLSQAIDGYMRDKRITLAPTTLQNYKHALNKLQGHFVDDPDLNSITSHDIRDLLDRLGTTPRQLTGVAPRPARPLSKKTLLNVHAVLSSLWTWATAEGYATEHIMRQVPPPQPEQRAIIPYTRDDIEHMLTACGRSQAYTRPGKRECTHASWSALRNRAIILLMLDTGLRARELCDLRIEHLDQNNNRLKVFGKGSKERILRIGTRTSKAIWRYLATRKEAQPTEPLFLARNSIDPLSRFALHRLVKRLGQRAGVTPAAHPHRFRHTFAIAFLRNGGDIYSLKALLGHSSLEMVQQYLMIAQADTEAAHRRASPVDNWNL